MSTKEHLVSLLRREALTVNELAQRLGITRNAVIVPLRQLEAAQLVVGTERREKRVGKPALEYAVVAGQEDLASRAYPPFAELLLQTLPDYLGRQQIDALMQKVGRQMAASLRTPPTAEFAARLKIAIDFADQLGAETVVERTDSGAVVRSYSCPLGRAVRREPCACSCIAAFFAAVTEAQVDEQCERGERLRCQFLLTE
ncbi:MAG: transcriptional regulator [Acidobacteriota bacterium]